MSKSEAAGVGHNSGKVSDSYLQEQARKYAAADQISAEQNEIRKQIRDDLKDAGIDPKAFQDAYNALKPKKDVEQKEEYMQSFAQCAAALDALGQESLFSYFIKKEEERKTKKAEKKDGKEKHPLVEKAGFGRNKKDTRTAAQAASDIHKAEDASKATTH